MRPAASVLLTGRERILIICVYGGQPFSIDWDCDILAVRWLDTTAIYSRGARPVGRRESVAGEIDPEEDWAWPT